MNCYSNLFIFYQILFCGPIINLIPDHTVDLTLGPGLDKILDMNLKIPFLAGCCM